MFQRFSIACLLYTSVGGLEAGEYINVPVTLTLDSAYTMTQDLIVSVRIIDKTVQTEETQATESTTVTQSTSVTNTQETSEASSQTATETTQESTSQETAAQ